DFERRHLWLQIVSGDLRRRHEQSLLARIFLLDTAIEEVSDVRILLCLRKAIVAHADTAPRFRQQVAMMSRWKCDGQVERVVIHREANKMHTRPIGNVKLAEACNRESSG